MDNNTTTVKYESYDKIWCEWYTCELCGCIDIMSHHKYCPECGKKIVGR